MQTMRARVRVLAVALMALVLTGAARGQNPVQWSGSVSQSVERAREQALPLLFWVSGGQDIGDDDDLADAQSQCFRDPVVVAIIRKCYVPVRVSRNSRVLAEAQRLGLPTAHGLYCAVMTAEGRLLDQVGPVEVADPRAFASHLMGAFSAYCDDLYEREIRGRLRDVNAPKEVVRPAVQVVYRLGIRRADLDIVALLGRTGLTPSERARLYDVLAALGTQASIGALLDRAAEREAREALSRVNAGALEWLLPELPGATGAVLPRQVGAYEAAARVCGMRSARDLQWWSKAGEAERKKELDLVRGRAEVVREYWMASGGGLL
jgi:hypothetical protein